MPRLLDTVAQKQRAGMDIRIIISSRFNENWEPGRKPAGREIADNLRAINLDNFTHCHNKGVIVDNAVIVSSTNWSENSIRSAREAGILIQSPTSPDSSAKSSRMTGRRRGAFRQPTRRPVHSRP